MTPHQHQALIRLQDRLRRAIMAYFGFPDDAEDLVQEANVGLIEKANRDPCFLVQTPAYVVQRGMWIAGKAFSRERGYRCRVIPLDAVQGRVASEVDIISMVAVQEAIALLDGRPRAIATGLAGGQKKREIAAELGITPQAVSWQCHHGRLRQVLEKAL